MRSSVLGVQMSPPATCLEPWYLRKCSRGGIQVHKEMEAARDTCSAEVPWRGGQPQSAHSEPLATQPGVLSAPPTSLTHRTFKLFHRLSEFSAADLGSQGTRWVLGLS